MGHSVNTQLIIAEEPKLYSYIEFDENDKDFKMISGSSFDQGSYERVSSDDNFYKSRYNKLANK